MNGYGLSDVGRRRTENQDVFRLFSPDDDCTVAAVFDGMGGAHGGKVAALDAAGAFEETFGKLYRERVDTGRVTAFDLKRILSGAVAAANDAVFRHAASDATLLGMGSTLCAVCVREGTLCTVNVGDSRAYRLRDEKLERLTHDHSLVQLLVDSGEITEEAARTHPKRNMITRAIGAAEVAEADLTTSDASPGDVLLLCTDGVTEYLDDALIANVLSENPEATAAAAALIDIANQAGGGDNLTAVVLHI